MSELSYEDYKKAIRKSLSTDLDFPNVLNKISDTIEKNIETGRERFGGLRKAFEKEFNDSKAIKATAEALSWAVMNNALELYFIGDNSALFVELHGLLERFCLTELPKMLANSSNSEEIICELISRKTLKELAEVIVKAGIWDSEDMSLIKKLANIRNGIAHKNVQQVSKHLSNGSETALNELHKITKKVDCMPYILSSLRLLVKLSPAYDKSKIIDPRFEARLNAYKNLIPKIFNLCLGPEIQKFIDPEVRPFVIRSYFAESMLVSSKKTEELLIKGV